MDASRLTLQRLARTPWLAAAILALVAARSLVPAGFMLAPVGGSAELRFCAAGLHPGPHTAPHAAADPSCPFAQSAGPAPIPALPPLPGDRPVGPTWQAQAHEQAISSFGPPRQPSSRGPPSAP